MVRQNRACKEFWDWVKTNILGTRNGVMEVDDFGVWVMMVHQCVDLKDTRNVDSVGYSFQGKTKNNITVFVYLMDVDGEFNEENVEWIRIKGRGNVVDIYPPSEDNEDMV